MKLKAKCTGVQVSGNQAMPYLASLQVEGQSVQVPTDELLTVGQAYTMEILPSKGEAA